MFEDDELDAPTLQRILQERALALAQLEQPPTGQAIQGYVVFALGKEKYGIPIQAVQEIRPLAPITRIPNTPPFYLGLVNLRGHLYPVLNLSRYLNLPEPVPSAKAKLVLVAAANLEMCVRVDQVLSIDWIADAEIEPLIEASANWSPVVRGTTPQWLSILDPDRLVSDPQLVVQDSVI